MGNVHATSASSTTVDCDDRLIVEFDDVVPPSSAAATQEDWWIFNDLFAKRSGEAKDERLAPSRRRFSKEPAHILAIGKARVETSVFDPVSGERQSRALLIGPRLSLNLRSDVSKMLIEGPGKLLLEDFRPARPPDETKESKPNKSSGFFSMDRNSGPSKTLIEWKQFMWYDFSIDQTRFEGDVSLKHFSGAVLEKYFGTAKAGAAGAPPGRRPSSRPDGRQAPPRPSGGISWPVDCLRRSGPSDPAVQSSPLSLPFLGRCSDRYPCVVNRRS